MRKDAKGCERMRKDVKGCERCEEFERIRNSKGFERIRKDAKGCETIRKDVNPTATVRVAAAHRSARARAGSRGASSPWRRAACPAP
eukprot:1842540-Prymnesium_polylepis.1